VSMVTGWDHAEKYESLRRGEEPARASIDCGRVTWLKRSLLLQH
jgi:hypothetical protein